MLAVGMENAIAIPEQAKAALLDHEQTVPSSTIYVDHRDRAGEILRAVAERLFGRINELYFDSFFFRLVEFERNARLRELASLERGRVDRPAFDVGLMKLQLALCLLLPPGAD